MFSSLIVLALALSPVVAEAAPGADASASAVYRHVGATPPPHGYPQILEFHLSTTTIKPGRPVSGSVVTSDNVGYVEARIGNYNAAMHRDAPGQFSLTYTVPWWLPFWLRHAYPLQVIARTVDGVETVREIGISVK